MIGFPMIQETDWAPTTKPIGRAIWPSGNQAPTPANPAESRQATPVPVTTCASR